MELTPLFTKYLWFKKMGFLGFKLEMNDYSIEDINFFCEIEQAVVKNGREKPT